MKEGGGGSHFAVVCFDLICINWCNEKTAALINETDDISLESMKCYTWEETGERCGAGEFFRKGDYNILNTGGGRKKGK